MRDPPITVNIPSAQRKSVEGEYCHMVEIFMGQILSWILNRSMYEMGENIKNEKKNDLVINCVEQQQMGNFEKSP